MSEIRLEKAAYGVNGREILCPLTLTLDERRIGVVGRNGSGKSTLARLLAGLIAPTGGAVAVGGDDLFADRKAALARVGILFQNPDHQIIFPTCGEEVSFGLVQQGRQDAEAAARAALAEIGKEHWWDRPVGTLSGGQRHLLCLVSVLAMAPEWLILDEPFAGLDIPTTRALHARLAALPQRVVMISHDPAALEGFDRVIWLEAGEVAADGPAGEVLVRFRAAMEGEGDDLNELAG
ncbi:energy-coupling factor ABC transporter ATP-binding protein [Vannielia litorea]|uniref:energy-coupling factor ABC transporter ATP-binding protein n=1 Tax=Vannielia litorea TaxID=1217970 RepID=UPI001C94BC8D|nr:ABC transporter ATP-binding protein [Vannielia litorea]MBY6046351.1 energy-coupling factor ABC transporter ATP-binding protein [Vannielia litorea]MBY6073764.1 energy-coupling factor ABC transporter ATP-binding protein [Vannielia litorea]